MNTSAPTLLMNSRPLRLPIARWLLYALILAFPFFSVEPKLLRPDWWAGALLILAFGLSVLLRGRLRVDPIGQAALGLHVAVLLSVAVNSWGWGRTRWTEFLTLWAQLVFATLLYLALANLRLSLKGLRNVMRFWISIATAVALYGLYQTLARNLGWPLAYILPLHGVPSPWALEWGLGFSGYIRPSSFLREPTYLGNYLLGPLLLVGTLVATRRDRQWLFSSRRLNKAILAILLGAFVVSFALAAYITLGALLILGFWLYPRLRKLIMRLGATFLAVLILLFLSSKLFHIPFAEAVESRLAMTAAAMLTTEANPADPSARERLYEAKLALKVWMEHPVLGIGLNQMQFVAASHAPADALLWQIKVAEAGHIHNMWLEVLVQVGLLGFVFFLLLWLRGLRLMGNMLWQAEGALKGLALGLFYVLLATMIHGLMEGPFTFVLYWFYLGLASVVYRLHRRRHETFERGNIDENLSKR